MILRMIICTNSPTFMSQGVGEIDLRKIPNDGGWAGVLALLHTGLVPISYSHRTPQDYIN